MQFLVEKSAYAIPRQVVSFHESVIHSGSTDPPVLLRHRPLANKSWAKPSAFVSFLGKYYAYSSISLHLRHRRLFLVQQPFRYPLASSFFLLSNAYFVQTSSPPDRNFVSYANVEKQMLFTSQRHRGRGEERERAELTFLFSLPSVIRLFDANLTTTSDWNSFCPNQTPISQERGSCVMRG